MRQLLPLSAEQVAQQTLLDVQHIVRPLGHVAVFQILEDLGVAPQRTADRVLRREMPRAHQRLRPLPAAGRRGASAVEPRRSRRTARRADRPPRAGSPPARATPPPPTAETAAARPRRHPGSRTAAESESPRCPGRRPLRSPRRARRQSLERSASCSPAEASLWGRSGTVTRLVPGRIMPAGIHRKPLFHELTSRPPPRPPRPHPWRTISNRVPCSAPSVRMLKMLLPSTDS